MKKHIIHIANKYKKNNFFKISLKNSYQVILRFFVGILNIKILSIWLGASGLALMGQFGNFVQIAVNFAGGGINQGVTKLSAVYSSSKNRSQIVLGNSLLISFSLGVIASLASFLLAEELSIFILSDVNYSVWFKAGGILFFSLSCNNVLIAYLNGKRKYKEFIRVNILSTLINVIISVPLIYFWRLDGAIFSQFISAVINLVIVGLYCRLDIKNALRTASPSWYTIKRVLGFGLMLLFASSISPIVSIIIRRVIIHHYSLADAGLWEGISRISKTIFGLGVSTLSLYYIPMISNVLSGKLLHDKILDTIKMAMPIIFVIIFLIYIYRKIIVNALFTEEFYEMQEMFLFQNIGDFFRLFNWFFSVTLIIKEKITVYILSEIFMSVVYIALIYFLIPIIGVKNLTLPYMLNTVVYLFLSQYLYRKYVYIK